jgi:hypothetical protein
VVEELDQLQSQRTKGHDLELVGGFKFGTRGGREVKGGYNARDVRG